MDGPARRTLWQQLREWIAGLGAKAAREAMARYRDASCDLQDWEIRSLLALERTLSPT
jgi:hypothetical protein